MSIPSMIYKSPLFANTSPSDVDALLKGRVVCTTHGRGELIVSQGAAYHSLLLIVRGGVRCEMMNDAGDLIVIEELGPPHLIAPAILYAANNRLPVSVIALKETVVAGIARADFTSILRCDQGALLAFLGCVSNRGQFLAQRIRQIRFGTIRNKLAAYLLKLHEEEGASDFAIPHTQQQLADMFGVTRPALSRVLLRLGAEGAIRSNRNRVAILDHQLLGRMAREY